MEAVMYKCLVGAACLLLAHCQQSLSPCTSDIYCDGELLHTVQMAHLHKDSKHFVDMSMLHEPSEVYDNFQLMMDSSDHKPSVDQVRAFVDENFAEPGGEFVDWNPTDWKPHPKFLDRVRDVRLRKWMRELHAAWKQLGRQVSAEVFLHPQRFSLIYVPNPTIVPGGRFREFYYWDSYWIIKGLLLSEMTDTVRGMLENFMSMVQQYGMVPNGGRIYFSRRSQPPMLIPMVHEYVKATKDIRFLRLNFAILEKEYNFWRNNRTVEVTKSGQTYTMYRYMAQIGKPRPESYREDIELTAHLPTDDEKQQLYDQLASACETGWDFSTRWISHPGTLKDLRTSSVVPVDLNALMMLNAKYLAEFASTLGRKTKAALYHEHAETMRKNIRQVFWDESAGSWFDWDLDRNKSLDYFYMSNIYPVWVGASSPEENEQFLRYLASVNATEYVSGVPTSLENSGEQWDFPNSWPPLQHIFVESLQKIDTEKSRSLAADQVRRWVDSVYISYMETKPHAMFEKYDVTRVGLPGGGGEYDVQLGFGWSNGVVMTFVSEYSHLLVAPPRRPVLAPTLSPVLTVSSSNALSAPPVWVLAVLVPVVGVLVSIMVVW